MSRQNYWPFDDHESERHFRELAAELRASTDGGVAFFGAGASAPAGLPTWGKFHRSFLEHFGAQPSSDGPQATRGVLTDIDYHTDRHPAGALAFVKETFAAPISRIPPLVQLTVATRSLRYFYTTNFDEVLFEAAEGKPVAVYPNYKPMVARFVYLHGRASTANSVHDELVLGSTGYDRAYNESQGSLAPARSKLRLLARWPVIFIGFSMTDQWVGWQVEEITRAVRYRRVTPVDGEAVEAVSPLSWYILLKAPALRAPRRREEKRSRENVLGSLGVQIIWYRDGGASDPHRSVLEVIQRIRTQTRGLAVAETDPGFLESLLDAEDLASSASPTKIQVKRAVSVLGRHPRIAAAFLERVDGVHWFRSLRDVGALAPKPKFRAANDELHAPYWGPVGFIERVATEAPSEVRDFLLSIETDNWVATRQAFEILKALDEPSGVALASQFARWTVEAMAIDTHNLFRASRAIRKLGLDGKFQAALALAEAMLQELADVRPPLSDGSASGFSEIVAPILARSESSLGKVADTLRTALERQCVTPQEDDVRHSRRAIETDEMDQMNRSVVGLLIDVMRDTLLRTDIVEWRTNAVARLLQSPWPTERRIGIAHSFLKNSDLRTHEADIVTTENLANSHLFHELAKLITDDAAALSEQSVRTLKEFVAALHAGDSEGERYEYRLWARVMPEDWLPEPPPEDEDEDIYDSDSRLFRDFYSSGAFSPTAPVDSIDFADLARGLTSSQLLGLIRDPAAAGVRVTWRHDTEEMWSLLAEYAKDKGALAPLLEISLDDLSKRGTWHAIDAIPEVAGDDLECWRDVLDWADRMVLEAAADQLCLLGRLLESSAKSIPLELSEGVVDLATPVIKKAKRASAVESEIVEGSLLGGYFTHPAGRAVQALLELLRRQIAESEAVASAACPVGIPQWFIETVLTPMEREPLALGIDAWIGVGRFYWLLSSQAPDSVAFVAQDLESESQELSTAATAFWAGYLWSPGVSSDALGYLREAYKRAASIMQQDGVLERDLRHRFFEHLVIGTLREVQGYEDLLLTTLGADFTAETRGLIAVALGNGAREASSKPGTPFHVRATEWFQRYWAAHVARIGGQDGTELAKYLDWLRYLNLPPSEIAEPVEASLAQADSSFQVEQVIEYLGRYIEEEPIAVLGLLDRCVDWYRLHGDFWLDSEKVRAFLDRIAPLTVGEGAFLEVVGGFAELGGISTDDVRTYLSGVAG